MIILTNRESFFSEILNNKNFRTVGSNSHVTLVTGNKMLFKKIAFNKESTKVFYAENLGASFLPRRGFGISFVDQVMINNEINLTLLSQSVNHGIIFPYFVPAGVTQFFLGMDEYRREVEAQERVRAHQKEIEEEWKHKKEEWIKLKKEIKQKNELKIKEFKEAISLIPEEAREYIQAPSLMEIPEKPKKPIYQELPKVKGIQERFYKLQNSLVWKILRHFEYLQVEGTNLGLLKKREKALTFNIENILSLKIGTIAAEDFYDFVKNHNIDGVSSNDMKQSFNDPSALELFAEVDFSIEELKFSEETEESITLPPLAPIKPMHAASMLAGGIGEYYREVILNGDRVAIKAAMVKEPISRTSVINGLEIKETIEQQVQKLGVYNIDRREFRLLG